MAKKRGSRVEKVAAKKKEDKPNPFEFKYAKRKSAVVSARAVGSGAVVGAPGRSKRRAVDARAATLAKELETRHRAGSVRDRRLGAADATASEADKAAMRFTLERRLVSSKKDIYKLGSSSDMDSLTHLGHSVASMETFDRLPAKDLDYDENLDEEFLAGAHFGGGSDESGKAADGNTAGKSRKELIDELIAKSRVAKHERQVHKDDADRQRERIDDAWKQLAGTGAMQSMVKSGKEGDQRRPSDSYDTLMRQLQFDANQKRASASERTKSDAELAAEHRRRLEALEAQRLIRMNAGGGDDDSPTVAGRKGGAKMQLAYDKEGKMINSGILAKCINEAKKRKRVSFATSADGDDGAASSHSDGGDDDDSDADVGETKQSSKGDRSDSEMDDEPAATSVQAGELQERAQGGSAPEASDDIPYVLPIPAAFQELCTMLRARRHADVSVILERVTRLHHPSLEAGNKRKLSRLFTLVLRYFDTCASKVGPSAMPILDALMSSLYDLAQFDACHAAKCVRALLKVHTARWQKHRRRWPKFATFALFSLVAKLFPTSDRRHCVVTPAFLALTAILGSAHLRDWRCISKGLLACSILLDYVHKSKRYIPEVIGFLMEAIYAGTKLSDGGGSKHGSPIGSLPLDERAAKCLLLQQAAPLDPIPPIALSEIFAKRPKDGAEDGQQQSRPVGHIEATLLNAVKLVERSVQLYDRLPYSCGVYAPVLDLLTELPAHLYVHQLRSAVVALIERVSTLCDSRFGDMRPLSGHKSRQSAAASNMAPGGDAEHADVQLAGDVPHIAMYEPRTETNYDPDRKKHRSKGERAKLTSKVKRERRGAIRELRRDNEFVARKQLAQGQRADADRRQKTKRLMHSLRTQEADFKALQKEKAKMKKKMGA